MQKKYHLKRQPIPEGYRIYERRLEIHGLSYHKTNALRFCAAQDPWLEFVPDPGNVYDRNAIKVMGCWQGWFSPKRKELGFVAREIAARLAAVKLAVMVRPRLLKTYVGHDGYVEIEFQIIGPASRFRSYRPLVDNPA